ncbi:hypothetical protein KSP40_PGU014866 [Platanthera guangdongensis]|uniref:TMEM205-like domain-containing protein n=1 Tax=Platanthera guangdongensis TaxID=2320717 RepID=A0ABR2MWR0_9ASPA
MMMNIVAISLFLSSLAAAGVLSPPPDPNPVLREGHRLIVVEYERELPPASIISEIAEEDDDKLLDDGASIISHPSKEKISSLISKTKHKAAQLEESGSDAVASAAGKVKDAAANISDAAKKIVDRAEETAEELRGNLTDILRRARELGRYAAAHVGVSAAGAARSALAVAHLLGFGIALGSCVWVTFLSSRVLASSLARQQFAVAQSRIYPVYFRAVGFGVAAAAAAIFLGSAGSGAAERTQGYILLAALAMVMVNMLYLEPKATKPKTKNLKTRWIFLPKPIRRSSSPAPILCRLPAPGRRLPAPGRRRRTLQAPPNFLPAFNPITRSSSLPTITRRLPTPGRGHPSPGRHRRPLQAPSDFLLPFKPTCVTRLHRFHLPLSQAMFERMRLEKEEGRGMDVLNAGSEPAPAGPPPAPISSGKKGVKAAAMKGQMSQASSQLRRLNSYSSFLNVLSLMALGWHLVHLSRRLESSC